MSTIDVSVGIIGLVVTIGIARSLSRFYYESEEQTERNKVLSTAYVTYAVIACLSLPFLLWVSNPLGRVLLGFGNYGRLFMISFISLVLGGMIDIGMMYLRLIKKPTIFITITVTRLFLLIAFNVFFIVHLQWGVLAIFVSSLIANILFAAAMTTLILIKTKVHFSLHTSVEMLWYGLPIIPSSLGSTAVKQSDKYFVLYFMSVADMGIYSLALKFGNAVHNLLTIPFNMAYIPRRFEIMNRTDAKEIYSKIFTYYIFTVGYIGLALSLLIPEILQVMVTSEFFRAGKIVPLVVLSMVIFGCQYHFDFGILHSKKTKYLAYINVGCSAVQVGLNFLLIKNYGMWGAVWSSTISLGLQTFLLYLVSDRLYRISYEFGRIGRYMLVACLFYGISTQLHAGIILGDIGIKLLLLILFPVATVKLKIISEEEVTKLKEIYRSRIKSRIFKPVVTKKSIIERTYRSENLP
jgi:O-antigen/teichoic acid export membrane protein